MPELPEVETIRRELARRMVGKTIASVTINVSKMVSPAPAEFLRQLLGKKIVGVKRRAKMLILTLSGNRFLVFHLKMTGQLVFVPAHGQMVSGGHPIPNIGVLPNKFTHLIFRFRDGSTLYFNDQRKFGWVKLVDFDNLHRLTATLGVEPLSRSFTWQNFLRLASRYPNRMVKQVLMDSELLVGVCNIYSDEACFCAGLRPTRRIKRIGQSELSRLYHCIPRVLRLAIRHKGTTSNTYRRVNGQPGQMLQYLKVYGRKGLPCKRCGTSIARTTIGQRGAHFCPRCQR